MGLSWGLGRSLPSYHKTSSFPAQLESGPCRRPPPAAPPAASTCASAAASFLHAGESKGIQTFSRHHTPTSRKAQRVCVRTLSRSSGLEPGSRVSWWCGLGKGPWLLLGCDFTFRLLQNTLSNTPSPASLFRRPLRNRHPSRSTAVGRHNSIRFLYMNQ